MIAINSTDVCVGHTWITPSRKMIKNFAFTASIFQDNFFLITQMKTSDVEQSWGTYFASLFGEGLGIAVKPFENKLWFTIMGFLALFSVCKWMIEADVNEEDYPRKNAFDALGKKHK